MFNPSFLLIKWQYLICFLLTFQIISTKITAAELKNNINFKNWPKAQPINSTEANDTRTTEIHNLNITYVNVAAWPSDRLQLKLGAVSAVAFDIDQNVVIFHRVNRIWDGRTFDNNNIFTQRRSGPLRQPTVLAFDRATGTLVYQWGSNLFYLPHGLTIDHENNAWVTDVALHQVFKFGARGSGDKPLMVLGTAFSPGAGENRFCKPTSVAVLENGDFFVADGYCNARIIKFNARGERILYWGQNSFAGTSFEVAPPNFFAIPHALTFVPDLQLICTADRENGRIQCFHYTNGTFHSQYYSELIGDRLFSMDYTQANGGQFVVVNGPAPELGSKNYSEVWGYVMDFKSGKVLSKFGPNEEQFHNPHDIVITPDGKEIYVAELSPMRIHKFTEADSMSLVQTSIKTAAIAKDTKLRHPPSNTAIIVVVLMLFFSISTFLLAWVVATRRQRGKSAIGLGQPNELVYRRLVASCSNFAVD